MANAAPSSFTSLTDLASSRFGGKVLFATDEWFATADNLLSPSEPVFIDDKFTEFGKWMDGWETRRKRIPGHDWCIIKLGLPGLISGIDVNTAFFTGNNAPRCNIQAAVINSNELETVCQQNSTSLGQMGTCSSSEQIADVEKVLNTIKWTNLLPLEHQPLNSGYESTRHNYFEVASTKSWTHVRLNIFPDGGVARLRLYGIVKKEFNNDEEIDLAAATNGGRAVMCSDAHYGEAKNLIGPGRGINMGDGWETARKPSRPPVLQLKQPECQMLDVPGSDYAILKLATRGTVTRVQVDTLHFKGNFPESCMIEASDDCTDDDDDNACNTAWTTIVPRVKLSANHLHTFDAKNVIPSQYLKVTIYPDGGISRLRAFGRPTPAN